MRKFLNTLLTGLLISLLAQSALAQDDTPKPVKIFSDHERIKVTLKGPWRTITRRVTSEKRYPGELVFTDSNGHQQTLNVGITTRGLTRRERVCDFPPLKLWFDKDQVKGTAFRGQSSLKMVTHCKKSRGYDQYYIKEYLSYRLYNLITPYSFKVRSMGVTYEDSERDDKTNERFGFLIEDVDDVADRNDLKELEIPRVSYRRLDADETSNYMLFQYLISNLDWSATSGRDPVECCHNSKLISEGPDAETVFVIPYDLDSSGLVDAQYAAPPEKLGVRSVRDRLFRGFCVHNDALPAAMQRYQEKKQDILDLFNQEDLLTSRGKSYSSKFVEGFYKVIDDPDDVQKKLIGKCRGK